LYVQTLNSSDALPITQGPLDYPGFWTPDGKELVFAHADPTKRTPTYGIYVVSIDQPDKTRPLLNTSASETYPTLSPDGHWLAYCSNKSGRSELYVQPYPGPGAPVLVSTDGAVEPVWSRKGDELFYRSLSETPPRKMNSVKFKVSGSNFVPETPTTLFEGTFLLTTPTRSYDVAPDGRFLMSQAIPGQENEREKKIFPYTLRIVSNWTEELQRLVAPAR
jgi:Tol biopolymer transport system component